MIRYDIVDLLCSSYMTDSRDMHPILTTQVDRVPLILFIFSTSTFYSCGSPNRFADEISLTAHKFISIALLALRALLFPVRRKAQTQIDISKALLSLPYVI